MGMTVRYACKTAPRPEGEGWKKCASVGYFGAPHFWYRRHPEHGRRQWFTYDRQLKQWLGLLDHDHDWGR